MIFSEVGYAEVFYADSDVFMPEPPMHMTTPPLRLTSTLGLLWGRVVGPLWLGEALLRSPSWSFARTHPTLVLGLLVEVS